LCYYIKILTILGGHMKKGPSLVIQGTIIGSLVVALLGWLLAKHIEILPDTAVAYAASPTQVSAQAAPGEDCQVSASYPQEILQWCETISSLAKQAELPPDLIAAVILQESGGDASAYSSSGAVGLMQVMPQDGIAAAFECINGPCFASRPTIEELQNPSFNIEYGTRMLAGLIGRLGNLREALKSYGPMDVDYRYADTVLAIYENYR
jgi:soluble lytic murein transglycosylase-like protein